MSQRGKKYCSEYGEGFQYCQLKNVLNTCTYHSHPERENSDVNIVNSSFLVSVHFSNLTVSGDIYILGFCVFHPPSTKKQIISAS